MTSNWTETWWTMVTLDFLLLKINRKQWSEPVGHVFFPLPDTTATKITFKIQAPSCFSAFALHYHWVDVCRTQPPTLTVAPPSRCLPKTDLQHLAMSACSAARGTVRRELLEQLAKQAAQLNGCANRLRKGRKDLGVEVAWWYPGWPDFGVGIDVIVQYWVITVHLVLKFRTIKLSTTKQHFLTSLDIPWWHYTGWLGYSEPDGPEQKAREGNWTKERSLGISSSDFG